MVLKPRRIALHGGQSVSAVVAHPGTGTPGTAVILAHGAGNDMQSPFVSAIHEGLAARGYIAVKFNFPYKEQGRRAPDPAPALESCYEQVVDAVRNDPRIAPRHLVIGGKSLGGRMATHLAAQGIAVDGVILLGYPLHPPGKADRLRVAHLGKIRVPMLFFAGTRDPLCTLDLLKQTLRDLPAPVELHVIEGGDHSFNVLKSLKRDPADVREEIIDTSARWLAQLGL